MQQVDYNNLTLSDMHSETSTAVVVVKSCSIKKLHSTSDDWQIVS
jgi:hypothetical protein